MIIPSDVKFVTPTIDTSEVEKSFDRAINTAASSGRWPAVVRSARDGASIEEIRAAVAKYRVAGWRVVEGTGDTRATIWHPSCPESSEAAGRQGYRA